MYQMHYKIFEVQVVGISKNNLQRFEILESNTHIRPTLRIKFLCKTNQKEILCCATWWSTTGISIWITQILFLRNAQKQVGSILDFSHSRLIFKLAVCDIITTSEKNNNSWLGIVDGLMGLMDRWMVQQKGSP